MILEVADIGDDASVAGQGMLAIEARAGDGDSIDDAGVLEHPSSRVRLECERAVVARLNATCYTPVGASTELDGRRLLAFAYVGLPDGSEWIVDSVQGDPASPAEVGATLAERMLSAGARRLLEGAKAGG